MGCNVVGGLYRNPCCCLMGRILSNVMRKITQFSNSAIITHAKRFSTNCYLGGTGGTNGYDFPLRICLAKLSLAGEGGNDLSEAVRGFSGGFVRCLETTKSCLSNGLSFNLVSSLFL